jgi:hypothetical protein
MVLAGSFSPSYSTASRFLAAPRLATYEENKKSTLYNAFVCLQ